MSKSENENENHPLHRMGNAAEAISPVAQLRLRQQTALPTNACLSMPAFCGPLPFLKVPMENLGPTCSSGQQSDRQTYVSPSRRKIQRTAALSMDTLSRH